MLTPAGTAIFRSYVSGLIWLQSWGPLYAVLHRISMGEAAERMAASALMPGATAVSRWSRRPASAPWRRTSR